MQPIDRCWRIDRDGKYVDGGGGKLMGSEDEVVGCIGERKVSGTENCGAGIIKWYLIFLMDSNIIDIKEQTYL